MFSRTSLIRLDQLFTVETCPSITSRSDTSTRSIRDSSRRRLRRLGTWTGPGRSPGSIGRETRMRRGSTERDRCRSRSGDRASTRGQWPRVEADLQAPDIRARVTRISEDRGRVQDTVDLLPVIRLLNTSVTMDHLQVCGD